MSRIQKNESNQASPWGKKNWALAKRRVGLKTEEDGKNSAQS